MKFVARYRPSALIVLFALAPSLHGQHAAGRLAMTLNDSSGAVVQAGKIVIRKPDSQLVKSAITDQQGRVILDAMTPGHYHVSAFAAGFEPAAREDVEVAAGRVTSVTFTLTVARNRTVVDVTAPAVALPEEFVPQRPRTSDSASLLGGVAGLALFGSGGVSSIPVIHGLGDDRVNLLVNGMSITPACGNHMNPPLSYIDPANVGRTHVMAGITPVSAGGDSLAGTVLVESPALEFAGRGQGPVAHGAVSAFHRGNGVVNGGSTWLSLATANLGVRYTGSYVNANDYKSGAGLMVKSTFYESQNHVLRLAARHGPRVAALDVGYQHIPQQGFVNARMDMTGNEAKFVNLSYGGSLGRLWLDSRVYYQDTRHSMNILRDKIPGMNMPMYTNGTNVGFMGKIQFSPTARDTLRMGTEYLRFTLDDWWTPVSSTVGSMGPDTLWNIRDGRRDRFGTFLEWETRSGRRWTHVLGIRSDIVRMDTGNVAGYNMSPTALNSAAYFADASEFNARTHGRLDSNLDLTATTRYEPARRFAVEFGYARKTRSPSLYERYLWVKRSAMSANMNGWFGDGNGYAGNLDLRPEIGHTLSATATWQDSARQRWQLQITPYFTRVRDYIDVDRCPVIVDGSNGCTAARFNATSGFVTLRFANHAARLYGIDVAGRIPLGGSPAMGSLALNGVFGWVRGTNLDTRDNLYQLMPLNARVSLDHRRGHWSSAAEFLAVDAKKEVQAVRNELPTAGYALLNVRSGYEWPLREHTSVRFDAGVDNLTNRNYALPLGGRYWIGDKTGRTAVPGAGRSLYGGLTFQF